MNLSHRLRTLFRRREVEAEMAEEMRFHLEQRAADYAGDGLDPAEARLAAQRRFGNLGSIQERARDAHGWGWLERLFKDLQLAVRQLAKAPGFALLAIGTLALGIGANTSMFNVLNILMLKPLPYADSANLDRIDRVTPQNPAGRVAPADFLAFQREAGSYGQVCAYAIVDASLAAPGQPPDVLRSLRTTANFFSVLGVQPQLGRDFRPAETVPGNDRVLLLSQRCWQVRFGGKADIIGRTLRVDGESCEIIGVLPASFDDGRHFGGFDLFRPLAFDAATATDRQHSTLRLIGRRLPRLSRAEADAIIAGFGARLAKDFPEHNAGSTWRTVRLNDTVIDKDGGYILAMLIGLSGFVLLIACSNLANLLLARTIARTREFAVRAALGASRLQLLRPLIAEALVLSLAGGACAIVVARWAMDYLSVRSTDDDGARLLLEIDWLVLGWALAASLVTALAFGLAPALFALRLNLNETLKSGGRGAAGGRGHQRFRHALIVGQFALAMVLLGGAALFIRGLNELNSRRAGWNSDHLVTGSVVLRTAAYPNADRITAFDRLAVERLEALPGVASATVASSLPFFNWPDARRYLVEGRERPERGHEPAALVNRVGPRYFETVGTRLLAGRVFTARDTATSAKVFIINQTMAADLFPGENPLGHRLTQVDNGELLPGEIVGVVADVKSVVADPAPVSFQLYEPMSQEPGARVEFAVLAAGVAPASLVDGVRNAITALDPDLPIRQLQTADATIYRANYQLRVLRDMLSTFALLGLALASLGVYGVIARTMAQRTGEFAIRLALGASMQNITRLVLTAGVKLALLGSALGLLGALGVSRILAAGFPAMHLSNPVLLLAAMLVLVAVALLACWLPARRAGRVDAMVALRAE